MKFECDEHGKHSKCHPVPFSSASKQPERHLALLTVRIACTIHQMLACCPVVDKVSIPDMGVWPCEFPVYRVPTSILLANCLLYPWSNATSWSNVSSLGTALDAGSSGPQSGVNRFPATLHVDSNRTALLGCPRKLVRCSNSSASDS